MSKAKPIISNHCKTGRHDMECCKLACICSCHDHEDVEDRTVTLEVVLRAEEERKEPPHLGIRNDQMKRIKKEYRQDHWMNHKYDPIVHPREDW